MRSYIFTDRERKIILQYLYTPSEAKNGDIRNIKTRVRYFSQIPKDIELYLRLTEAMKMDKQILESLSTK
jgi:hypothetical protein